MLRKLPTKTLSADLQLATVRAYFAEHGTALCNAAGLIDGEAGTARVLRLMSGLREASRLDRTTRRRLVDLHRLLSLDPVVDAFEPDLASWMFLDPARPEVEEFCLLTDRLFDLLVEIGELDDEQDALALACRRRTRPETQRRPCLDLRGRRHALGRTQGPIPSPQPSRNIVGGRRKKIQAQGRFLLRRPEKRPMFSSPAQKTSL